MKNVLNFAFLVGSQPTNFVDYRMQSTPPPPPPDPVHVKPKPFPDEPPVPPKPKQPGTPK